MGSQQWRVPYLWLMQESEKFNIIRQNTTERRKEKREYYVRSNKVQIWITKLTAIVLCFAVHQAGLNNHRCINETWKLPVFVAGTNLNLSLLLRRSSSSSWALLFSLHPWHFLSLLCSLKPRRHVSEPDESRFCCGRKRSLWLKASIWHGRDQLSSCCGFSK